MLNDVTSIIYIEAIMKKVNYIILLMFGETRLTIPYFQQMTLHSKISKIIHIPLKKMDRNVNYFGVECELFWSGVSILFIILGMKCFYEK